MTKAGSSRLNLRANRAVRLASRSVERQQFVSTMKLVDTLAEQEELERSSRRASQPHVRPRDSTTCSPLPYGIGRGFVPPAQGEPEQGFDGAINLHT
jgi:hypothetical protein